MKKIIYFLAALIAVSVVSCKDDDVVFDNVNDLDRLPMPMFRKKHNTNVSDEADLYASKVIDGHANAIQLHWYGVEGAAAYEIRYAVSLTSGKEEDWQNPARNVKTVTVPADQLHYEIYNLEYLTDYRFCILAIHPTDPAKNSLWYGMGDGRQWEDYLGITTGDRYTVPYVIDTRDADYHSFKVLVDLNWDRSAFTEEEADTIESRFKIVNGQFTATHLVIKASPINPDAQIPEKFTNYDLSQVEFENGQAEIDVTDLDENTIYLVAIRDDNNTEAAEVDRYYNYGTIRTKGDPGAPIKIEHKTATSIWIDPDPDAEPADMDVEQMWFDGEHKYDACRIDTVIANFNKDVKLAEGQTFLLEGGKAYYIRTNQSLSKGFTLRTDPADILAGKGRAKVYLGGIQVNSDGSDYHTSNGLGYACNWNLGKEREDGDFPVPIKVESVIFMDIDFDCPAAINFGNVQAGQEFEGYSVTGNYFANMASNNMAVEFQSFEIYNCTFNNIIRGFYRTQSSAQKIINKIVINNCVFHNNGYYDNNGRGYHWFVSAGNNPKDNIFKNVQIVNNTFYDSCRDGMFTDSNKDLSWADDISWNIRIENNTFINYGTRSSGRNFFNTRFVPGGSTYTFKRNLICLARDVNDHRNMNQGGADVRQINGSGLFTIDISDNYSTGYDEASNAEDGIMTGGKFTATKNSFGSLSWAFINGMTGDDLKIKVGETPLYTTELFVDPNPKYHATSAADNDPKMHYIDPSEIWSRLQYKNDLKVTTHEIYTKNIGDQRWKTADPKWFYPAGAPVPEVTTPETPAE